MVKNIWSTVGIKNFTLDAASFHSLNEIWTWNSTNSAFVNDMKFDITSIKKVSQ